MFAIDTEVLHPLDASWSRLVDQHLPAFMLGKIQSANSTAAVVSVMQVTAVLATTQDNMPVVLLDNRHVEFYGSKLHGFILNTRKVSPRELLARVTSDIFAPMAAADPPVATPPSAAAEPLPARVAIGISAISAMAAGAALSPLQTDLARAFVAHLLALEQLSVADRALALPSLPSMPAKCGDHIDALPAFLTQLWPHLEQAFAGFLASHPTSVPPPDLWDGRLLYLLLLQACGAGGKGASSGASLAAHIGLTASSLPPLFAAVNAALPFDFDLAAPGALLLQPAALPAELSSLPVPGAAPRPALAPLSADPFINKVVPEVESEVQSNEAAIALPEDEHLWQHGMKVDDGQHLEFTKSTREEGQTPGEEAYWAVREMNIGLGPSKRTSKETKKRISRKAIEKMELVDKDLAKEMKALYDYKARPKVIKRSALGEETDDGQNANYRDLRAVGIRYIKRNDPQRQQQKATAAVFNYAQSLQGGPIQETHVFEGTKRADAQNEAAGKGAEKGHAGQKNQINISQKMLSSLRKTVETLQAALTKQGRSYADVEKAASRAAVKAQFALAWQVLDKFVKECDGEAEVVRNKEIKALDNDRKLIDDAMARAKRKLLTKKGGKGGKKGGKGAGKAAEAAEEEAAAAAASSPELAEASALLAQGDKIDALTEFRRLASQAMMQRLGVSMRWWYTYLERVLQASGEGEARRDAESAEAWACSVVLDEALARVEHGADLLKLEDAQAILRYICEMGFNDAADHVLQELAKYHDHVALGQVIADTVAKIPEPRTMSFTEFQLSTMAPRLPRPTGQPDARTHGHFKLDGWQKTLLDIVDQRQSALISAPTSSGKTFISYYAMEETLREASKGEAVVVYVSPSHALVNQVEAEVYARFKKTYPPHPKRTLCGVFTPKYGRNETTCQILITVPECLEIMLVSPDHVDWVKRLKWVIFDEVHCIASTGGEVWEHLLLMIKCPFLALSATIGNPGQFEEWLGEVERARGRKLHVIRHNQRWNDISPYVYDQQNHALVPINPASVVSVETVVKRGTFPPQTKLLPEHCVQLHAMMSAKAVELSSRAAAGGEAATSLDIGSLQALVDELQALDPRDGGFFRKDIRISMRQAAEYEQRIKACFVQLATIDAASAEAITEELFQPLTGVSSQDTTLSLFKSRQLLDTLRELDDAPEEEMRKLPAIVFHLDERGCDKLVQNLVRWLSAEQYAHEIMAFCKEVLHQSEAGVKDDDDDDEGGAAGGDGIKQLVDLVDIARRLLDRESGNHDHYRTLVMHVHSEGMLPSAPADWLEQHPEAVQTVEDVRHAMARSYGKKRAALLKSQENKKKAEELDELSGEAPAPGDSDEDLSTARYEADYVDPRFTFLPRLRTVTDSIIQEVSSKKLRNKSSFRKDWMYFCLLRGIGLHYSELPRPYKNTVERLFRLGLLRVVVATGTLALGINMPCRTVIVLGDSPQLDTQQFHQMSGRAGRRGFDLRGNVIFLGTPRQKIQRLLSSDLNAMTGHVPLTPTMVLRLYMRYRHTKKTADKAAEADTTEAIARIVKYPFFCVGGDTLKTQVEYLMRFCLEFLLREGALAVDASGADAVANAAVTGMAGAAGAGVASGSSKAAAGDGKADAADDKDGDDVPDSWDADDDEEEGGDKGQDDDDVPDAWDADSDEETTEAGDPAGEATAAAGGAGAAAAGGEEEQQLMAAQPVPLTLSTTSSLVCHLYFVAPSNLLFVAFLRAGLFEQLCLRYEDADVRQLRLLEVMANLFHPRRVCETQLAAIAPDCPSMVRLPPLPAEFQAVVDAHNRAALETFSAYARLYVEHHGSELAPADVLPGSLDGRPLTAAGAAAPAPADSLLGRVAASRLDVKARSPFVAASGHDDSFGSVDELVASVRSGVYLDKSVVPVWEMGSEQRPANAFLVDFFQRESREELVKYNGMPDSQLYDLLREFVFNMQIVSEALRRRVDLPAGEPKREDFASDAAYDRERRRFDTRQLVTKTFETLTDNFHTAFRKVFAFQR